MKLHLAILTIALAAMPAMAQHQPTDAKGYVAAAGAGDLYERLSSEMVSGSRNDAVRDFAKMMLTDHARTTAQVKTAAGAAGLQVPPPKLMPKQQAMIDELKRASGAERDTVYVRQQLAAHQEALALHSGYAKAGDTPALKQVAAGAVPVIEHHLNMVQKIRPGAR
jgi:putative membrane protein